MTVFNQFTKITSKITYNYYYRKILRIIFIKIITVLYKIRFVHLYNIQYMLHSKFSF